MKLDFDYKRIGITAVILTIVGFLFSWITCGWLFNWVYALEPTSVWKGMEMNAAWYAMMLIGGFILNLILVGVYDYIRKGIPLSGIQKGLCFGVIVWLVGTLPGMVSSYAFVAIATTVIVYWTVQLLIKYLLFGAVIAYFYELKK